MILFIDDEAREMDSYKLELEYSGYTVKFIKHVDEAYHFCETAHRDIELIILDIMIPPGSIFRDIDTLDGLRSGMHLYQKFRAIVPTVPVIIFTNVTDAGVEKYFKGEHNCAFLHKEDFLPFQLVDKVNGILLAHSESPSSEAE